MHEHIVQHLYLALVPIITYPQMLRALTSGSGFHDNSSSHTHFQTPHASWVSSTQNSDFAEQNIVVDCLIGYVEQRVGKHTIPIGQPCWTTFPWWYVGVSTQGWWPQHRTPRWLVWSHFHWIFQWYWQETCREMGVPLHWHWVSSQQ